MSEMILEPFDSSRSLPLLIRPTGTDVNWTEWVLRNKALIEEKLLYHGGILFRNFNITNTAQFEQFTAMISPSLLAYNERSSPRSLVQNNIYTSTEYPANEHIFLHNENSYQHSWPQKIFFFCLNAAQQGGETPIADSRRILKRINPSIRERFSQKKVMYVRNFGDGFGLPWQTVFQTEDKRQVETYCEKARIHVEWKSGDRLRTLQIRPAIVHHPLTDEAIWFNHAVAFHVTNLDPIIQQALLAEFEAEDLPSNAYYGDGTPIDDEVLLHLRDAYLQEQVLFPWHEGDVLLLDNMLTAHGRSPFIGSRKVLVAMSELVSQQDIANKITGGEEYGE